MQRYTPAVFQGPNGTEADAWPNPNGPFVRYSDALAAQAADKERIRELAEALNRCICELHELNGDVMGYEREKALVAAALGSGGDEKEGKL